MKTLCRFLDESGLALALACALALAAGMCMTGCAGPKTRSIEARGMYASDTGQLAIGALTVDAVPENGESAIIHYTEDTAWLSPGLKIHKIHVFLTGASSASCAKDIADVICRAFVDVAANAPDITAAPGAAAACDTCTVPALQQPEK